MEIESVYQGIQTDAVNITAHIRRNKFVIELQNYTMSLMEEVHPCGGTYDGDNKAKVRQSFYVILLMICHTDKKEMGRFLTDTSMY